MTSLVIASGAGPDKALQSAVLSVFTGECLTASEAGLEVAKLLDAEGYSGWTIESRAASTDCVTAGVIEPAQTVVLLPVDGPDVSSAMEGVRSVLMSRCLNEADTKEFVGQVLTDLGESEFEIRTDGPRAYPIGQGDVVMEHVDAGCFVYSGSGRTEDGAPVYYIFGDSGS